MGKGLQSHASHPDVPLLLAEDGSQACMCSRNMGVGRAQWGWGAGQPGISLNPPRRCPPPWLTLLGFSGHTVCADS